MSCMPKIIKFKGQNRVTNSKFRECNLRATTRLKCIYKCCRRIQNHRIHHWQWYFLFLQSIIRDWNRSLKGYCLKHCPTKRTKWHFPFRKTIFLCQKKNTYKSDWWFPRDRKTFHDNYRTLLIQKCQKPYLLQTNLKMLLWIDSSYPRLTKILQSSAGSMMMW